MRLRPSIEAVPVGIRRACLPGLGTAAVLLASCAGLPAARTLPPPALGALLAPERIAALPAAEREAWTAYLARSGELRAADAAALAAELRRAGLERAVPAPRGAGVVVERGTPDEWFRGEEARRTAEAILSYQTPSGGWSKRLDLSRPRAPGESYSTEKGYIATFDNDATTEQLDFLRRAVGATGDPRYLDALRRGVEFALRAQFPNGCWPQVYPLQGGYHDAATLNDDAMVNVLRTLRSLEADPVLPDSTGARVRGAVSRGIECLVRGQVVVDGRRTVWAAQHDPLTLVPVAARSYEHPSLSGRESAAVLLLLMELEEPSPEVTRAVRAGVEWLREHAIHGLAYEAKGELRERPGAGPLWARFYEIGTGRPIFSNRDGVVRYRWEELDEERRRGYAWYTDEPARVLRRYDRWARRHLTEG